MISWMTNETKPANIVFLYHNEPDSHGHSFGAEDEETLEEVRNSDNRANYLFEELKKAGIYEKINIIILSDHGMQTFHRDNIIDTMLMADTELYDNHGGTPVYHIVPKNNADLDRLYESFKTVSQGNSNFMVYKKEELLAPFNYGNNRRIMDIVLLAKPGFGFEDMTNSSFSSKGVRGVHGYDNEDASMRALFIARGPIFKAKYNATHPINNIDLVSLFSKIMGITGIPTNGSLDTIIEILSDGNGNNGGPSLVANIKSMLVAIFIFRHFWTM